eukprot:XP_011608174.1 PREDICTED: RE1-silencing transcription factor-like isoform X2 [Takifugu rubripes]
MKMGLLGFVRLLVLSICLLDAEVHCLKTEKGHVQAGQATVAVQKANETYKEWNGTSYHPVDRRSVGSQNAPPKQVSHSKFGQAGQRAAVNKPPVRKLTQPRSALGAERVRGLISVWRDETALGKEKEKPHIRARSPPRKIVRPQVQQKKPNEAVKKGPVSGSLSPPRKIVRPQVQQKRPTEAVKKGPVSGSLSPPRKIVRPQVQQKRPTEAVKKGPVSGSLSPPRKIVRPQVQQKKPTEAVKKGPVSGSLSPPRKIVRPQVQQKKPTEAVKKGPVSGSLSPPRKIVRPQVQQKKPTEAVKKGPVSGSLVVKDGKRKSNASQSPRGYVSVELSRGKGYAYVRHIKPGSDTRQQMAERTSSDRHFNLESEYSPRKQSGSWRLFHPHRAQKQGKFSPFQRLSGEHPRNDEYLSSNTFGETTVLSELNYTSVPLSPGDSSTISTAHLPTEGQIVGFEHQASTWEYQTLALPSQGPSLQATEKVSIAEVQQKLKLPLGTKAAD